MRLLALDLGTNLGYADTLSGDVRTGHRTLGEAGDHGTRVSDFLAFLDEFCGLGGVDGIAYELPRFTRGFHATRCIMGLEGVLLAYCEGHGIPYASASTQEVKRAVTGRPGANKLEMVAAAQAAGVDATTEDEADAYGVLLCGLALGEGAWIGEATR